MVVYSNRGFLGMLLQQIRTCDTEMNNESLTWKS